MEEEIEEEELEAGIESVDSLSRYHVIHLFFTCGQLCRTKDSLQLDIPSGRAKTCCYYLGLSFFVILMINMIVHQHSDWCGDT